jgi:hypothetical protein
MRLRYIKLQDSKSEANSLLEVISRINRYNTRILLDIECSIYILLEEYITRIEIRRIIIPQK